MGMYPNHFQTLDTPQEAMTIAREHPQVLRNRGLSSLLNLECFGDATPEREDWEYAASFLSDRTELDFTADNVEWIAQMYPEVRNALCSYGHGDSVLEERLTMMASHFFLSCSWPTYGDELDVREFVDRLHEQAEYLADQHRKHMEEDGKTATISFPVPRQHPKPTP